MSDHTIWVHNRLAQFASLANLGINNRVHLYTAPPFGCLANNGSGLQAAQPDIKKRIHAEEATDKKGEFSDAPL